MKIFIILMAMINFKINVNLYLNWYWSGVG